MKGLFTDRAKFFEDFETVTKRFDNMFTTSNTIVSLTESGLGTPVDSAVQTEDGYRFTINAAGFKKEEISVSVEGKIVSVEGESSRFKNKLNHFFTAPKYIDTENIKATLIDGVLEIEVPFLKEKNTSVKIKVS